MPSLMRSAADLKSLNEELSLRQEELERAMTALRKQDPNIALDDSPLRIVRETAAWPQHDGLPRVAGVSSFGFGGVNAHVQELYENLVGRGLPAWRFFYPKLRLRGFYRTVFFIPTILSFVIVGFVWKLILSPLWGVAPSLLEPDPPQPGARVGGEVGAQRRPGQDRGAVEVPLDERPHGLGRDLDEPDARRTHARPPSPRDLSSQRIAGVAVIPWTSTDSAIVNATVDQSSWVSSKVASPVA